MAVKVPAKRRAPAKTKLDHLDTKQQAFLFHMLASVDMNGTECARKAGYADPKQASFKLLRDPVIRQMLGKIKNDRLERLRITADDVAELLYYAVHYFDPIELGFEPYGDDGSWCIDPKQLKKLDRNARRMIDSIEHYDREDKYGNRHTSVKVYFKSYGVDLLPMALKHFNIDGVDKIAIHVQGTLDVTNMYKRQREKADPIQTMIEQGPKNLPKLDYTPAELVEYNENDLDAVNEETADIPSEEL